MIKTLNETHKQQMIDIANQNFTDELQSTLLLIDSIKNDNYLFIGAFDGEILVSYLIVLVSLDDVCITSIATRNSYKNKGYAIQLINYLKNIYSNKSISLEVKQNNLPAISLYEKCGFKTLSVRRRYYKDKSDAFCMFFNLEQK